MNTTRTPNTLLSSAFALLFAAAVVLSGCSAGALTGPEAQPASTVVAADVQAPQNNSEDNNGEGGTEASADHNTIDPDDE